MNKLNLFLTNALTSTKPILMGKVLDYGDNTIEGIFNQTKQTSDLIMGGFNNSFDTTFLINNTDLEQSGISEFIKGEKVELDSIEWKILSVDKGDVTTLLTLGGWNESTLSN